MSTLIISDLHLTDKPEDDYRWAVWKWANTIIQKRRLDSLWILGDVLDKKDRHASALINRLADNLTQFDVPIRILRGNHDTGADVEVPLLRLFSRFKKPIEVIIQPNKIGDDWWLPHSRQPTTDWVDLELSTAKRIFLHQTVIGSKVSNFYEMDTGFDLNWLIERAPNSIFYSGDIHVPQSIGPLTYIGTPYPVAFGDTYTGRGLILTDEGIVREVTMKTIQRPHIKISTPDQFQQEIEKFNLKEGDQVKVTIKLTPADFHNWTEYKKEIMVICQNSGIELHDIKLETIQIEKKPKLNIDHKKESPNTDPNSVLKSFVKSEKLSDLYAEIGFKILRGE